MLCSMYTFSNYKCISIKYPLEFSISKLIHNNYDGYILVDYSLLLNNTNYNSFTKKKSHIYISISSDY